MLSSSLINYIYIYIFIHFLDFTIWLLGLIFYKWKVLLGNTFKLTVVPKSVIIFNAFVFLFHLYNEAMCRDQINEV